jgi:hypothetical protein
MQSYNARISRASEGKNLSSNYPDVAREWHPKKNGDKKPEDFTPKSHKKAWWLCERNRKHEWEAAISHRTGGSGCPYCAGKKPSEDKNLLTKHPDVAREWHLKKNGDKKPEDFTPKSNKKAWWLCKKNPEHEWEAVIYSRTQGHGCPFCAGRKNQIRTRLFRLISKCTNLVFL